MSQRSQQPYYGAATGSNNQQPQHQQQQHQQHQQQPYYDNQQQQYGDQPQYSDQQQYSDQGYYDPYYDNQQYDTTSTTTSTAPTSGRGYNAPQPSSGGGGGSTGGFYNQAPISSAPQSHLSPSFPTGGYQPPQPSTHSSTSRPLPQSAQQYGSQPRSHVPQPHVPQPHVGDQPRPYNSSSTGISPSPIRPTISSPAPSAASATESQASDKSSPRIDPRQIPRPSNDSGGHDVEMKMFHTRSRAPPPPATAQYCGVDEGNCRPRFIRLTCTQAPHDRDLIDNTRIGFGAIIQPLANVGLDEEPVPVVDCGPNGPVRCSRCKCYVNPFFKFLDNGKKYICNMCGMQNAVDHDYVCNLDAEGFRRDKNERMELCRGSVEFVASPAYITKEIQDPCYLFAIDVSYNAIVTGVLSTAVNGILSSLEQLAINPRVRVGIITFDDQIHFYNLKSRADGEPEVLAVGDLENMFVPVPPDDLLVYVNEEHEDNKRIELENLLNMLPTLYDNTRVEHNCLGTAVQAAEELLGTFGGKFILIHSSLPNIGPGKLENRDDVNKYGTDKERDLFKPQSSFYEIASTRCAEKGISIDLFSCSNTYVDLATIGHLCTTTGGQIFYYPGFNMKKDGDAFYFDMYHNLTRNTGFDGVMIVRASAGLRVGEQFGNFFIRHTHEMELPSIDSDKTFAVKLEHEDKLEDKSEACIQAALLYTTSSGERRIRVHTISFPVTSVMGNIFRTTDLDAIVNLSLKQSVNYLASSSFHEARKGLVTACVEILYTYRKFCAHASSTGQLILPESLKLLPLYTLGLIKNAVLADKQSVDDRAFLFSYVMSMPCHLSVPFVYPRLYSLHDLKEHECILGKSNNVTKPDPKELSRERITSKGLYLLDNGRHLFLSVGHDLDRDIVYETFGLDHDQKIDAAQLHLLEAAEDDPYHLASRVRLLIDELRYDRPNFPALTVMEKVLKKSSSAPSSLDETAFLGYLIDDDPRTVNKNEAKSPNQMSYVDFLVHLHRRIQDKFL